MRLSCKPSPLGPPLCARRFLPQVGDSYCCCRGVRLLALLSLPLRRQQLLSQSAEMEKSCSECSVPTLAQSLCTLCNKWLCYQCTDVHQHQRGPTTSQYTDLHQQQRPSATQCPDPLQIGSNSLPPIGRGPGSHPCSLLMCHSHRQEPLELFCESCDLLCCSSCHLSSHKNHRSVLRCKAQGHCGEGLTAG